MYISKSDFLLYLQCPKHFWLWKKKREVVEAVELSDFQKQLIEQGNEVEGWARKLYRNGVLVESKGVHAVADTQKLLEEGNKQVFQATFLVDGLYAMVDVLEWDNRNEYWVINEVKGSSAEQDKTAGKRKDSHLQDATFQKVVLEKAGYTVGRVNLIELNKEFRKDGDIVPSLLLVTNDITNNVAEMQSDVLIQADDAKRFLAREEEPKVCECIYKSRNNHCPSFSYSHPEVPDYSVHDIVRIGNSLSRLREIIDNDWLRIEDIPLEHELSPTQTNHVHVTITGNPIIKQEKIHKELEKLKYPLYFLDYETFPKAIPVFDGCYPYQQVPFQYSLHILTAPGEELIHKEFLQTELENPMSILTHRLREDIGNTGSVIVWNKKFEGKCNEDLAEAVPELAEFLHGINNRFFDLMEIFSKQLYVHKDFKGSASIKYVLPVLAPGFSYEELNIRDGGMALNGWKEMIFDNKTQEEQSEIASNLLAYCELDTLAMVKILEALEK
jgi:hypothetical protein